MADSNFSVADVAIGADSNFQLIVTAPDGGQQRFELAIAGIPELVQSLTAVAWASAASNRPAVGTKLPPIIAFPVKHSEVGLTQESGDPVLAIELFGGVKIGLHFSVDGARTTGQALSKVGLPKPRVS